MIRIDKTIDLSGISERFGRPKLTDLPRGHSYVTDVTPFVVPESAEMRNATWNRGRVRGLPQNG